MAPASGSSERAGPTRSNVLGWGLCLVLFAYAAMIHQGVGPAPVAAPRHWYEPSGFLRRVDLLAFAFESRLLLFACFTLPAALLAACALAFGRSAVAGALALSCVVATPLLLFYGDVAPDVWEFFGWRGSAVIALTAACAGFAAAAPLLAASWLRLAWPSRLACYAPIAFGVIAFIRNATGTDETLRYSISPWPALPVFGLEVAAVFAVATQAGVAVAIGGVARAESRPGAAALATRTAAAAAGLGVAVGLVACGGAAGVFPFGVRTATLVGVAGACAVAIAAVATWTRRGPAGRRAAAARSLALGVVLAGAPLATGQLWARWDYHVTRESRAREIIAALNRFAERETLFPDALTELVAAGDLSEIPAPAIGFAALHTAAFRYQSFGSSFLLEFEAPRWVECAYTPAYTDEDTDDTAIGEYLDESWSCPSEPPELW